MSEELLGQLGQIEREGEFGILGLLNSSTDDEVIGALREPKIKSAIDKALAFRKTMRKGYDSRSEFAERISMLDKGLQRDLLTGKRQLVDTELFIARPLGAKTTIKMLQPGDKAQLSGTNQIGMINDAKLEKGEVFLLSAIQLTFGINATLNETEFVQLEPAIRNGYWEFKGNGKVLVPYTSNEVFMPNLAKDDTTNHYSLVTGDGTKRIGYYKLANPKLIFSQTQMEFNIEWTKQATANANLKVTLIGSRILTY